MGTLYTTSTLAPTTSAAPTPAAATPRSLTGIILGSVIGSIAIIIILVSCWIYGRRRARPRFKLHQTDSSSNIPITALSASSSAHALFDLAAEPQAHPSNIEPWVAPTSVRRPEKVRPPEQEEVLEMRERESTGPSARVVEPVNSVEPSSHGVSIYYNDFLRE
jgi:hypothetical protein